MGNSLDDLLTDTSRGTANPVGSGFRSVMSTRSRPCRRALIAVPSAPYTESVGLLSTVLQLSPAVVVPSSLTLSHTCDTQFSPLPLPLFSSSSPSPPPPPPPSSLLLSHCSLYTVLVCLCLLTALIPRSFSLFLSLSLSLSLSLFFFFLSIPSRLFSSINFSVLYYIHYVDQYAA